MKKLSPILGIVIIALTGCEPNEMYPSGGIPLSGSNSGSYTAPARNLAPMMQDPEAETVESGDYVWANSESEAWQKCQKEADRMTEQGGSLVTVKSVKSNKKGTKWFCTFNGEQ
jgi:hypothetical protein